MCYATLAVLLLLTCSTQSQPTYDHLLTDGFQLLVPVAHEYSPRVSRPSPAGVDGPFSSVPAGYFQLDPDLNQPTGNKDFDEHVGLYSRENVPRLQDSFFLNPPVLGIQDLSEDMFPYKRESVPRFHAGHPHASGFKDLSEHVPFNRESVSRFPLGHSSTSRIKDLSEDVLNRESEPHFHARDPLFVPDTNFYQRISLNEDLSADVSPHNRESFPHFHAGDKLLQYEQAPVMLGERARVLVLPEDSLLARLLRVFVREN